MNIARLRDTAGKQDALSAQFKRFGNILTVFYPSTAEHTYTRVDGFDSGHGIADDGGVGGGHGNITANEFRRFNGDVGRIQCGEGLGFLNIRCTGTHREIIRQHLEQGSNMLQFDLVFGVIDDAPRSAPLHGGLWFKPTRESAQTDRVKMLRPHFNTRRLLGQDAQIKSGGDSDEGRRSVGMRLHGFEKCFSCCS